MALFVLVVDGWTMHIYVCTYDYSDCPKAAVYVYADVHDCWFFLLYIYVPASTVLSGLYIYTLDCAVLLQH